MFRAALQQGIECSGKRWTAPFCQDEHRLIGVQPRHLLAKAVREGLLADRVQDKRLEMVERVLVAGIILNARAPGDRIDARVEVRYREVPGSRDQRERAIGRLIDFGLGGAAPASVCLLYTSPSPRD